MRAFIKIVDKLTPVHGRFIGQEIKLTMRMTKNEKGEAVPDFIKPLYREELDENLQEVTAEIAKLKKKYDITEIILV